MRTNHEKLNEPQSRMILIYYWGFLLFCILFIPFIFLPNPLYRPYSSFNQFYEGKLTTNLDTCFRYELNPKKQVGFPYNLPTKLSKIPTKFC